MAAFVATGSMRRKNPFTRESPLLPPVSISAPDRPKSMDYASAPSASSPLGHGRTQSFSPLSGSNLAPPRTTRQRSISNRSNNQTSNTFAPKFIKTEELHNEKDRIKCIEGENDFSGKRYLWVKDSVTAFVKGWVVQELEGERLLIQCDDGSVR